MWWGIYDIDNQEVRLKAEGYKYFVWYESKYLRPPRPSPFGSVFLYHQQKQKPNVLYDQT